MRVRLLLFAAAREAAGTAAAEFEGADSLEQLLGVAQDRFGAGFAAVLATSRVWVNGDEPAEGGRTTLSDGDEVAVLPPVSGG